MRMIGYEGGSAGSGRDTERARRHAWRRAASVTTQVTGAVGEPGRYGRRPLRSWEVLMATRTAVVLEDDLDGGRADQTLEFGLDGTEYVIDLSARNAARFGRQLAPFIEHARKAGRGQRRRPGRPASAREGRSRIRAWAKNQGIAASERRRIPAGIAEQYDAAQK